MHRAWHETVCEPWPSWWRVSDDNAVRRRLRHGRKRCFLRGFTTPRSHAPPSTGAVLQGQGAVNNPNCNYTAHPAAEQLCRPALRSHVASAEPRGAACSRRAYPAPGVLSTWLRLDSITEARASSSPICSVLHMPQALFSATSAYRRTLKLWLKPHCSAMTRACFRASFCQERRGVTYAVATGLG